MDPRIWDREGALRDARNEDDTVRMLVDAIHDAMMARDITAADLSRVLGLSEMDVRTWLADPIGISVGELVRLLGPLEIALTPAPRREAGGQGARHQA